MAEETKDQQEQKISRRSFLKAAGASMVGATLAGAGSASVGEVPKPETEATEAIVDKSIFGKVGVRAETFDQQWRIEGLETQGKTNPQIERLVNQENNIVGYSVSIPIENLVGSSEVDVITGEHGRGPIGTSKLSSEWFSRNLIPRLVAGDTSPITLFFVNKGVALNAGVSHTENVIPMEVPVEQAGSIEIKFSRGSFKRSTEGLTPGALYYDRETLVDYTADLIPNTPPPQVIG